MCESAYPAGIIIAPYSMEQVQRADPFPFRGESTGMVRLTATA